MTEREKPPSQRTVSEDFVESLRRIGAPDAVDFADRHVARYSKADIEKMQGRWFFFGGVFTIATGFVVVVARWFLGV